MAEGDFELAKELAAELGFELPAQEEPPHLTDKGNAQLMAMIHGDDLRYCWETRNFYWWDGRRWVRDANGGKAEEWARDVAHKLYEIAGSLNHKAADLNAQAAAEPNPEESQRLAKTALKTNDIAKRYTSWALKSESSERMAAIVRWVRSERGIPIQLNEFDQDPWLLNCLNGTINLKTGELQEHRREDLISKVCPVSYDPEARFPLWESFLERIQPDPQMRGFLQRAAGYTLTGLTTEEKLFFCYGAGSTGKSTFLEALAATLGPPRFHGYSATADFDAFLHKDYTSGHSASIARLAGSRMVTSIEVDEGKRLAEGLVKQITGGDEITASHKYEPSFQFMPTFQLWLAANLRPRVRSDDAAMWRRILQIPFEEVIPEAERDPTVKAILTNPEVAGPAILAWMVQGCLDWQVIGLLPPQRVLEATEEYREEMDPVVDFIEECCVSQDDAKAENTGIYQEYLKWADRNGIRQPLGRKSFTQALKSRGFEQVKGAKGQRFWLRLGLIADPGLSI